MRLDVFLDTGVSVIVSDTLDLDTDEGLDQIKQLARAKFIDLLSNGFDIQFEYAGDEQLEQVKLKPHSFHGEWNYTIPPR